MTVLLHGIEKRELCKWYDGEIDARWQGVNSISWEQPPLCLFGSITRINEFWQDILSSGRPWWRFPITYCLALSCIVIVWIHCDLMFILLCHPAYVTRHGGSGNRPHGCLLIRSFEGYIGIHRWRCNFWSYLLLSNNFQSLVKLVGRNVICLFYDVAGQKMGH